MKAVIGSILEVWREERESWLFALRVVVASMAALYLAFVMQLDMPSSAAFTVVIVSLPQSGHVLEKAFYRLLGTLIGGAVSLLLVALFTQQPVSFLIGMATWIGFCGSLSLRRRNQLAYGFVLSGYTTFIVGYPAFMSPEAAVPIAIDRISAVGLGVLCATIVNATVLPRSSTALMVQSLRRRLPDLVAFAGGVLQESGPRQQIRPLQGRLLSDVTALESIRVASYFESADSRIRSDRIRRLNNEFLACSTAMHGVYRLREDLIARGEIRLLEALSPLTDALLQHLKTPAGEVPGSAAEALPVAQGYGRWLGDWAHHAQGVRDRFGTAEDQRELELCLQLLHWFAQDLADYLNTYVGLPDPRLDAGERVPPLSSPGDSFIMLASALRATLGIVLTGAYWMASGWTHGYDGMVNVCVLLTLFAALPNPLLPIKEVSKGLWWGTLFVVPLYLFVLPRIDGFAELVALHLPLLLLFGHWMAKPASSARGFGALVMLFMGLWITNPMHYDVVAFLNRVVSTYVGLGFAVLCYMAIPFPGAAWTTRRIQRLLLRQLRVAARQPLNDVRPRFESAISDLMAQLTMRLAADPQARERQFDVALMVLEAGYALIRLRQLGAADAALLRAVPLAFERPERAEDALALLDERLTQPLSRQNADVDAALRLLQLALGEWCDRLQPKTQPEVAYAA